MPDLVLTPRLRILGLGLLAGLAVGALGWTILATGTADQRRLQADQVELGKLKAPTRPPSILASLVSSAVGHPLFTLTTGLGAQPEPVIQVSGISRTPVHRAALLTVDGGAPEWLDVGQSSGGITLLDVQPSTAVVETPFGRKEIALDDQPTPPASPSGPQPLPPAGPPPGAHPAPAPAGPRAPP